MNTRSPSFMRDLATMEDRLTLFEDAQMKWLIEHTERYDAQRFINACEAVAFAKYAPEVEAGLLPFYINLLKEAKAVVKEGIDF